MSRMIRKQVYIRPEHDKLLKRRARELGVTEADLIRHGIERLEQASVSAPRDHAAWEEELAIIRERAKIPAPGKPRSWRRPAPRP